MRLPHAKGTEAAIGFIQCTSFLAVNANQKRPVERPMLPIIAAYTSELCSQQDISLHLHHNIGQNLRVVLVGRVLQSPEKETYE